MSSSPNDRVSFSPNADTFPPRRYWTSSLAVPWWFNKRHAGIQQPLYNPPFANFTTGFLPENQSQYEPEHLFQVPCDTITPSSERYQKTGQIEIIR